MKKIFQGNQEVNLAEAGLKSVNQSHKGCKWVLFNLKLIPYK